MNEKWGIKRVCSNCSVRFYDFDRSPIVCPACGAIFDPEYLLKKKNKTSIEREAGMENLDIDISDDAIIDDGDIEVLDDEDVELTDDADNN